MEGCISFKIFFYWDARDARLNPRIREVGGEKNVAGSWRHT